MAGSLTVRELITRYTFQADPSPLKQLDKSVDGLKTRLAGMDQAIRGALWSLTKWATAGIGAATVALVKLSSDVQESEDMFRDVFKDQEASVREWSNALAKSMGRSGAEIRKFAAGIQDTFVPLGFTRDVAAQLSENLVELGADVASFKNLEEKDVIDRFTSALVGNHEAVRELGLAFTAEDLKGKIKAMKKEMPGFTSLGEQQQKMLARYNIIMERSADAHGNATKTAGSFANRMKALRGRVLDLATKIGSKLIPVATEWANKLIAWVEGNDKLLEQKIGAFFEQLISVMRKLGSALSWASEHWKILATVAGALIAGRLLVGLIGITNQFASMASALAGATSGAGGLTGALGGAAGKAGGLAGALGKVGQVGMALGVGWTIGKVLDDALGLSDKLANGLFALDQRLSGARKARTERHKRQTQENLLEQTRKRLEQLRASGVQSVATRGGDRVALDAAGIARLMLEQRKNLGLVAPGSAPAATPGAGGKSVNVAPAQINITMPAGTTASQAQRVADAAGAATTKSIRSAMGDVAR